MTGRALVLTMGDPAGCGPVITAQAWKERRGDPAGPFAVIADPSIYDGMCPTQTIQRLEDASSVFQSALPVLPLHSPLPHPPIAGAPDKAFASDIIASIDMATRLCLNGQASGMVTNPISKAVLYEAGFEHPGHTEFVATICDEVRGGPFRPIMMLVGGGLKVALATIHIPLAQVSSALTQSLLVQTGSIVNQALKQDFGLSAPRIAFTGLNPHAGENGTIGTEEVEIINPAATALRAEGVDMANARPGDTVFHETLQGQFDAVIAMTHDQGLIPVKTLDIWGGVNTTLGLPIIRTSPDHGTAYDAAAKGDCRADSLLAAIDLAHSMARHRSGDT